MSSLACACIAMIPTAAGAYNVRLEDVENENLQSGLQSQIKSSSCILLAELGLRNQPGIDSTCQNAACRLPASVGHDPLAFM